MHSNVLAQNSPVCVFGGAYKYVSSIPWSRRSLEAQGEDQKGQAGERDGHVRQGVRSDRQEEDRERGQRREEEVQRDEGRDEHRGGGKAADRLWRRPGGHAGPDDRQAGREERGDGRERPAEGEPSEGVEGHRLPPGGLSLSRTGIKGTPPGSERGGTP